MTVVIPTYNERDGIAGLVAAVDAGCRAADVEIEIVVVDDNSPDGTGAIADELATRYRMKVVHRAGKLGLGTAVMAGMAVATTDAVAVMDADLSHPPALLPALYAVFVATDADVVVASRYVPGGATPDWPFNRRALSRAGCLLARPISPLRDSASGFFVIRRSFATSVEIRAAGFKIGLELLVRGQSRTVVEIPYQFRDRQRGKSKMTAQEAFRYLGQLVNLYWFSWTHRRPRIECVALTTGEVDAMVKRRASRHPR